MFWIVCCILELRRSVIDNSRIYMIDMINTINIIDYIDQYEDNRLNIPNQLTLQTPPSQLHHCCFIYQFP